MMFVPPGPHQFKPQRQYTIVAPLSTHYRPATCAEADCPAYLHGWRTVVDELSEMGKRQAHYIRNESGRRYVELREDRITTFEFEAGQRCFASGQHRIRDEDRAEIYVTRPNTAERGQQIHSGPDPWLDDFQTHQETLRRAVEG